jgi:hypothetical protein
MTQDEDPDLPDYQVPMGRNTIHRERYIDEDGVERTRLVPSQRYFDVDRQAHFLAELAEHGRIISACQAVGISKSAYQKEVDKNPYFAELVAEARESYKERLIAHHQNLVFNGQEKIVYDRQGNVISRERVYPIRLIELELKKHDEGYREKREVSMEVSGGVFFAPPEMTMEEWERQFSKHLDATAEDVTDVEPRKKDDEPSLLEEE